MAEIKNIWSGFQSWTLVSVQWLNYPATKCLLSRLSQAAVRPPVAQWVLYSHSNQLQPLKSTMSDAGCWSDIGSNEYVGSRKCCHRGALMTDYIILFILSGMSNSCRVFQNDMIMIKRKSSRSRAGCVERATRIWRPQSSTQAVMINNPPSCQ